MSGPAPASRAEPGRVPVLAGALAVGFLTFAFRRLVAVDLTNDHYMTLGWAQQVLFGALPDRDFVDPGMPLAYLPSALFQTIWPGPFIEMLFTSVMLGLAAAATCTWVLRHSQSWVVALGAVLIEVMLFPRLYAFPKILVPAVALCLFQRYAALPGRARLVAMGVWTTIAALLRHDLGAYVGMAGTIGLLAFHLPDLRRAARDVGTYAVAVAASFLPYALFVQWAVGWPEHLRRGLEFARSEQHQIFSDLPRLADVASLERTGATAALFFLAYAVAALDLLVLVWLAAQGRASRRDARANGAMVVTLLALFLPVVLRKPIDSRLPDLAAVIPLALAWLAGEGLAVVRRVRAFVAVPVLLVVASTGAVALHGAWVLGNMTDQIDNTGVSGGMRGLTETWVDFPERTAQWPWARTWPSRELPSAIRYLNACTEPSDFALLTWPAPEYYFFGRRRFGAGHVEFLPPDAFTTERDQAQMLGWMANQRIPVVLTNATRYDEFRSGYPRVATELSARYRDVGEFTIYDGSRIVVSVRTDLQARGTWGPDDWPCTFD